MDTVMDNRMIAKFNNICNLLHVCLANAIHIAMTDKYGEDWFKNFYEYDIHISETDSNERSICEVGMKNVKQADLQFCLKFLRRRTEQAAVVFNYYGYDIYADTVDSKNANKILIQLLNNLIQNVRNGFYAHGSAGYFETGIDDSITGVIYSPKTAIDDMVRLAKFFMEVKDSNRVSYYDRMCELARSVSSHLIEETIEKESLSISVGEFVDICNKNNIYVTTDENKRMVFESENYEGDIARIKLKITESRPPKTNISKRIAIVVAAVVLLGWVLATAYFIFAGEGDDDKKEETETDEKSRSDSSFGIFDDVESDVMDTVYNEASYGTMKFTVEFVGSNYIELAYENDKNCYSLGWANSALFVVETSSGSKLSSQTSLSNSEKKINPYAKGTITLYFDSFNEKVEKLSITGIYVLGDNGLPNPTDKGGTLEINIQQD